VISVAVSGAGGRMGRLIAEMVAAQDDLELVAAFDPVRRGEDVAGVTITADEAAVGACDVVVEFTVPAVVLDNIARWRGLGVHTVVGTSGFDAARLEAATSSWGGGPPNLLIVPNFSIGAVMMMQLAERAAPHFPAVEIIELHHEQKVDAPSGTALATAALVGDDVPIHSVRLPGLVAHQEVIFGGTGETLTIRHDTTDRSAFMPGVLLAVRSIADLPAVNVGLECLLSD